VITVQCLPVRRPAPGIKRAGMLHNGSPGSETALLPDDKWSGYRVRIFSLSRLLRTFTPK